ncbi:MAG: ribosome biogenesis GTPase YlqF [Eubacteriales bacterium]
MPSDIIQWFPGHMAKTRRIMGECLPLVDFVFEILDARTPIASKNPEIDRICKGKPRIVLFSKSALANPDMNEKWKQYYRAKGIDCIPCDFLTGAGMNEIIPTVRNLLSEKIARNEAKGMSGKALTAMVVGIPNVGKSSFINRFSGTKKAKVENRPGVTLEKQWVSTPYGIRLLDMPGVLWPKFDDRKVAENLAITGAIKDQVLNTDEIAVILCGRLKRIAPDLLCARYKLDPDWLADAENYDIFRMIGKNRGFLISGGEINEERTASTLLDEFRSGKIGRITLESSELMEIKERR